MADTKSGRIEKERAAEKRQRKLELERDLKYVVNDEARDEPPEPDEDVVELDEE